MHNKVTQCELQLRCKRRNVFYHKYSEAQESIYPVTIVSGVGRLSDGEGENTRGAFMSNPTES